LPIDAHINQDSLKELHDAFIAVLNKQGIIEVDLKSKEVDLTLTDMLQLREVIKKLGGGKKMPVLVRTADFPGITPEARKFAATQESGIYTLASAVMVKTLASRILFNFFMNINKPIIPTKGFIAEQEAMNWLLSFKNKN